MPIPCTASGPINDGDAVCLTDWDAAESRPTVKRAEAANLAISKTVMGVARATAAGVVQVLVAGEVADNSLTHLGVGNSRMIVTKFDHVDPNQQAQLRRIDDDPPIRERFVVGTADENGNLAIQPRHSSDETGFLQVFNVREYGAVGDDQTDDSKAFAAAMTAMGAPPFGGTVYVPQGTYKLSSDLVIDRVITLLGPAAIGGAAQATLHFDPGFGVFVAHSGGQCSEIRNLEIASSLLDLAVWDVNPHVYVLGDKVRKTDNNCYYFECTTAGTSAGGTEPFGEPESPGFAIGETITDGTVVWTARVHAGVICQTRCTIDQCSIASFTNSGVHLQGGPGEWPTDSNVNCTKVTRTLITFCGTGVFVRGNDSNGCQLEDITMSAIGFNQPGTGGVGIFNHSFLGSTILNCLAEGCTGRAYLVDGGGAHGNAVTTCYSENCLPSKIVTPCVVVGGNHGAGFTADAHTRLHSSLFCTNIVSQDALSTKSLRGYLDVADGMRVLGFRTSDDGGSNLFAWQYGLANPDGYWGLTYGIQNQITALALTNPLAAHGPGWAQYPLGYMLGATTSTPRFHGTSDAEVVKLLRGGERIVGDQFYNVAPASGQWFRRVITSDGWRGPAWVKGTAYLDAYPPYGIFADVVEPQASGAWPPAGLKVFRVLSVTGDGLSGEVEPDWTVALNPHDPVVDHHVTWELVGFTPGWTTMDTLP